MPKKAGVSSKRRTVSTTAHKTKASSKTQAKVKQGDKPAVAKTGKIKVSAPATLVQAAKASAIKTSAELLPILKTYIRANSDDLLKHPNVTSVGIGFKKTGGLTTDELAVQFTVSNKFSPQRLVDGNQLAIPTFLQVGDFVVPTDVLERSFKPSYLIHSQEAKDVRKTRLDPVQPGVSIANEKLTAGTLGTFVLDNKTNRAVLLSNWHVLVGPSGAVGDVVTQPGKYDDSQTAQNIIGKVQRHFLGPAGDCAIASLTNRSFINDQYGLPGASVKKIGTPELGDRVVKSGRTSAVTYGLVTRVEVNTPIEYSSTVKETIGGFEIGVDPKNPSADGEISKGGDSGSVWFAVDGTSKVTDVMLGLHFAGQDGATVEVGLACYANSVMNKLDIRPIEELAPQGVSSVTAQLQAGFDPEFLSFKVGIKKFDPEVAADLAKLDGDAELRYCHFSSWLNMKRKYPCCVAWNIDGSQYRKLKRTNFRADRRGGLDAYQLSDDFYKANPLDKGHIARRADLCWGNAEEAAQGNYDSFYFTNITPQHEAFNQSENFDYEPGGGLWGRLEVTIFDSENPHDLKVSLMGGPVLSSKDRIYEQFDEKTKIPNEFWKIVAYKDDQDENEKVFAFLLTQSKMIKDFVSAQSLDFNEWLWARISLRDLEEKIGVRFVPTMHAKEVKFTSPQSVSGGPALRICRGPSDYFSM